MKFLIGIISLIGNPEIIRIYSFYLIKFNQLKKTKKLKKNKQNFIQSLKLIRRLNKHF